MAFFSLWLHWKPGFLNLFFFFSFFFHFFLLGFHPPFLQERGHTIEMDEEALYGAVIREKLAASTPFKKDATPPPQAASPQGSAPKATGGVYRPPHMRQDSQPSSPKQGSPQPNTQSPPPPQTLGASPAPVKTVSPFFVFAPSPTFINQPPSSCLFLWFFFLSSSLRVRKRRRCLQRSSTMAPPTRSSLFRMSSLKWREKCKISRLRRRRRSRRRSRSFEQRLAQK